MSNVIVQEKRSRRSVPKAVRRLLLLAAALYVLPLVGLGVFQQQLVFGAARTHGARTEAPPGARLIWLRTERGERFDAFYGPALLADGRPDVGAAQRPTLLFFTGKSAALAGQAGLFQSLRRLDANVLMPEYIGFGQSSGTESEAGCFQTAAAAYTFLRTRPDVNQQRIVIAGYSLGSGVAVDLAAREIAEKQPVAGLALFAAYTSMADMGHQEYPIYPAWLLRLILRYPFVSDMKMARITCPVLLVHSRADRLIPYAMSDTLTALCPGPVTRLTVSHAGHAEYFSTRETTVFPALRRFLGNTHETQPKTD